MASRPSNRAQGSGQHHLASRTHDNRVGAYQTRSPTRDKHDHAKDGARLALAPAVVPPADTGARRRGVAYGESLDRNEYAHNIPPRNEYDDAKSRGNTSHTARESPGIITLADDEEDQRTLHATVVPSNETIEERIRREALRLAQQQFVQGVVTQVGSTRNMADNVQNDADYDVPNKKKIKPRWWMIALLLLVVLGGIGAALGIVLGQGSNSSTEPPNNPTTPSGPQDSCSFCSGAQASTLTPLEMNRRSFQLFQDTYTCATFQDDLQSVPASDETCPLRQALTWKHCGCPNLPNDTPQDIACTICEGGDPPSSPNGQCSEEEQYVNIIGTWMPNMCPNLIQQALSTCACPTEEQKRFRRLRVTLASVTSDDSVFDDESSHQSMALTWLATNDPLQLDVPQTPNRTIHERYLIVLLYYSMNGRGWNRQDLGFLTGTSVCDWHVQSGPTGVMCADSGGDVTSIVLSDLGAFGGSLPSEFGFLSALTELDLSSNDLQGSIPSSVGRLVNLENIDLSDNLLNGQIPPSIFNLPRLSEIDFDDNRLRGSIPDSISNATALTTFSINDNRISGRVPDWVGQSTTLDLFFAFNNRLTGPLPEFSPFASLRVFAVLGNELTGTIPTSLTQLRSLLVLALDGNNLVGTVPPFRGTLGSTAIFTCSGNRLGGKFQDLLMTLSRRLLYLDIRGNQFTGFIPSSIGDFRQLTHLKLDENRLEGTIPTEIGKLTSLVTVLDLSENQLSGTIPSEIGSLTLLEDVFFSLNTLVGTIPSYIGRMTSMKILELGGNFFSGTIPPQIQNCLALESIGLFNNAAVHGDIGEIIANLPDGMKTVSLGKTELNGTVPSNVGKFSQMEAMRFQNNKVSGSLPSTIGQLTLMTDFDIAGNMLTGTIPSSIGRLTRLERLEMGLNSFRMTLPNDFSRLSRLELLDVSENELSGSLASLEGLSLLRTLLVYGNSFDGVGRLCSGSRSWTRFATNICGSTPTVQCTCCTHCCNSGTQVCSSL